jgi:hypothetical protein
MDEDVDAGPLHECPWCHSAARAVRRGSCYIVGCSASDAFCDTTHDYNYCIEYAVGSTIEEAERRWEAVATTKYQAFIA